MFDFGNKKASGFMVAPQTGKMISIREVPDEVFSEKIIGDGAAIIPEENIIVSPVDGEVVQVAETKHAFCIKSKDGLDVLIHIGVDTIKLKGKGFKSFVSEGQKIKMGDPIGEADIQLIKESGFPIHSVLLITNMQDIENLETFFGEGESGKTKIISYNKK